MDNVERWANAITLRRDLEELMTRAARAPLFHGMAKAAAAALVSVEGEERVIREKVTEEVLRGEL
jgi:hypothetical protein